MEKKLKLNIKLVENKNKYFIQIGTYLFFTQVNFGKYEIVSYCSGLLEYEESVGERKYIFISSFENECLKLV